MKISISKLLFSLVIPCILLVSCRKDSGDSRVPYVSVNIQLYPNGLDYIALGDWVYITGGNRGIVVYRMTEDQFFAYDRTCPYDPEILAARVVAESPGSIIVIDAVCGSSFTLTDGYPYAGPSKFPLQQYKTIYDSGSQTLYISN
jgi:nitrite reductase/ring-hydroxylating ferredoxin subunit